MFADNQFLWSCGGASERNLERPVKKIIKLITNCLDSNMMSTIDNLFFTKLQKINWQILTEGTNLS